MTSNRFLIVIYTVTGGQHHEELGSDEQEIVLFAYLVLDIVNLKVRQTRHPILTNDIKN